MMNRKLRIFLSGMFLVLAGCYLFIATDLEILGKGIIISGVVIEIFAVSQFIKKIFS